jgi:exopolysaccharide biosynthesis protein
MIIRILFLSLLLVSGLISQAQIIWKNVDSSFGPLPSRFHIYYTEQKLDSAPFRAYYVIADLKERSLDFTTDTTYRRRISPSAFFEKNDHPLLVVNGTFFSFNSNSNLNLVMKEGKILSHHAPYRQKAKDTSQITFIYGSAIGIDKKRKADIAWVLADSATEYVYASQQPTNNKPLRKGKDKESQSSNLSSLFSKWEMKTAIGGGPVLVQEGKIKITNEWERKFTGKAIKDKHPRTAMGYTSDGKIVIMVVEGRNENASGATLIQLAELFLQLGCVEALNLDGGGSSCLLVNGKETIKPSDKTGQRPVPGVFMIRKIK